MKYFLIKEPAPIELEMFQLLQSQYHKNSYDTFLVNILKFHALILVVRKKTSTTCLFIDYGGIARFELQRQFIFSPFLDSFRNFLGGLASRWSSYTQGTGLQFGDYNDVRKGDIVKSPAPVNFHVNLSNSWMFYYFKGQIWDFLSWYSLSHSLQMYQLRFRKIHIGAFPLKERVCYRVCHVPDYCNFWNTVGLL